MSLLIKTAKGGHRHEISTAWNTKLTKKRAKVAKYVPAEVLYREINAGFNHFWSKRRVIPEPIRHQ